MIIACAHISLADEGTVYIRNIIKDSPAERAGLCVYDQIVSVDGTAVKTVSEFLDIMNNITRGNHSVSVIRDGKKLDFGFTLKADDIKNGFGVKALSVDLEKASEFFDQGLEIAGRAKSSEEIQKAIDEFLQAEYYAPFLPEVHYNLGFRYLDIEDYENAEKHLERYVKLFPNAPDIAMAQEALGKAAYMRDRIDYARKRMLDPDSWLFSGEEPEREPSIGFIPERMVATEFKLSDDGRIYAKNPEILQASDRGIKRYVNRQKWLYVDFKGRFFEYAYAWCYECPDDNDLDPSFIAEGADNLLTQRFIEFIDAISKKSTAYTIRRVAGEIKINGDRIMIVQTHYAYTWNKWDWGYYAGLWRQFITDKNAGKRFLDESKYLKCRVTHILK